MAASHVPVPRGSGGAPWSAKAGGAAGAAASTAASSSTTTSGAVASSAGAGAPLATILGGASLAERRPRTPGRRSEVAREAVARGRGVAAQHGGRAGRLARRWAGGVRAYYALRSGRLSRRQAPLASHICRPFSHAALVPAAPRSSERTALERHCVPHARPLHSSARGSPLTMDPIQSAREVGTSPEGAALTAAAAAAAAARGSPAVRARENGVTGARGRPATALVCARLRTTRSPAPVNGHERLGQPGALANVTGKRSPCSYSALLAAPQAGSSRARDRRRPR